MPYTSTNWVSGTTPCDQTEMNNLEQQYLEATNSFEQDFLASSLVYYGMAASKDGTIATQLDVTAGIAFMLQTDGTFRRRATTSTNFSTSGHPSTTMYLDLNPDGTWSWGTSHSGVTNYMAVAQVTTNASSQISTVTDERAFQFSIFPSASGNITFPSLNITGTSAFTGLAIFGSGANAPQISITLGGSTKTALEFFVSDGHTILLQANTSNGLTFLDNTSSTTMATLNGSVLSTGTIQSLSGSLLVGSNVSMGANTLFTNTLQTVSGSGGLTFVCGSSGFFGFKTSGGTKLAEMKLNTNFIIGGAYQTAGSTTTISGSQSFDSFDYAECYVCDRDYPNGTVVCLDEDGRMKQCTHDNCHQALIISKHPAYMAGADDEADPDDHVHPLALVGRVKALATPEGMAKGKHVVSDGKGGVRALSKGKWGYALGVAITDIDESGRVGILMRPMYCKGA